MKPNYSTKAGKIIFQHPLILHIRTQIIFWIFAFIFFFVLVYFISLAVTNLFPLYSNVHIVKNILISIFGALIFGTLLGTADYLIDRKLSTTTFGQEIFVKIISYTAIWFTVGLIVSRIGLAMQANFVEGNKLTYNSTFYINMGIAFSIYTLIMIVVISFIKEMDDKFGPGVIFPMLLGKYRKPRVEERIFLFIDLKSSTMFAEKLGHLKYSRMIQKIFADLNKLIPFFDAEIYQYVGDEVVLTWHNDAGLYNNNCINFFFAFKEKINTNKAFYEKNFNCLPEFKASAHLGTITVVEVGDVKREIAYHGDTINTASRIQDVCNYYKKAFLISEDLKNNLKKDPTLKIEFVDDPILKGKTKRVKIYSVEKIN